jgi:hypothetical protein
MNDELEKIWRKRSWPILRYYPGIHLEGLRETKNLSQDSQFPGKDMNPGTPK